VTEPIQVLVADDHPLFRKGLVEVLADDPSFHLVAEAATGGDALALVRRLRPRIAVLDIQMPDADGLEVAAAIRDEALDVAVVILTMHRDAGTFRRALDLGVRGYVLKDSAVNEIVACLHMVAAGRSYISPALSDELLDRRATRQEDALEAALSLLTPAERRVLTLIARGLTTAGIARELGNSPRTIENHRSHICRKLDLSGPQALLRFALERKARLA
jgi:DNA-binding NarL/FixJ family response regulator